MGKEKTEKKAKKVKEKKKPTKLFSFGSADGSSDTKVSALFSAAAAFPQPVLSGKVRLPLNKCSMRAR